MPPAFRRIRVHDRDQARMAAAAARDAGVGVTLVSALRAAGSIGPLMWATLIDTVRGDFPDVTIEPVLDCGDAPGLALLALRSGIPTVRVTAPEEVMVKLRHLAALHGGRLDEEAEDKVLDLAAARDPAAACRDWLG